MINTLILYWGGRGGVLSLSYSINKKRIEIIVWVSLNTAWYNSNNMNINIKLSIDAFNVSRNCDRTSPNTFYDSYVIRKKKIITGKTYALNRGSVVNLQKLNWEVFCLKEVTDNKEECLDYIACLLKNTVTLSTNPDILKEIQILLL